MKRIACVGVGYWGKNLVRNFAALNELHTICDSEEKARTEFSKAYPDIEVCASFDRVLANAEVPAVVIATPAATHYDIARRALIAGKDVFVEKPLALTLDEGRELVNLAHQAGRILMVGHILQYHPALMKLKQLVASGALGNIQYVYSNRLNLGKMRREENILWSFAPHDVSIILMLLEELPRSITASGGTYLQRGVADVTVSTMDFPSGVKGHIFVSWLHPYKEQRLVVVGDQKMAVFDDLAVAKLRLYPHRLEWINRVPTAQKAEPEVVTVDDEEPLEVECRHFIQCIDTRATPRTDGAEGMRVLEVLQACQQSLDRNGAAVSLGTAEQQSIARSKFTAHPTAVVDDGCEIGEGTKIWHFSHVMRGTHIGRRCNLGQNVVVGPNVVIGNNVKIQNNVSVYEGVTLEDSVFCGPSMVFTNVINPRSEISRRSEFRRTLVKEGASLGANCTVICGVTIGRFAFVAAGAVVTRDVPDYALLKGQPARFAAWMCRCGAKLSVNGTSGNCPECRNLYALDGKSTCRPIQERTNRSTDK